MFFYLYIISFLFTFILNGDFLTKFEYAQLLYQEPRGISCKVCHGEIGESIVIFNYYSYYRNRRREGKVIAQPINKLSFEQFKRGLLRKNRFMPFYRFSSKEIEALYFYLQESKKRE